MTRLIIIGARALGREVCNYAREAGHFVQGFLDDKTDALDGLSGYPPVLGSVEQWTISPDDRFVCAIGDSRMRAKYVRMIMEKGGQFISILHPTAYVGPNVTMGEGCIACPYAVIDCDLTLGCHVVVNAHAYVPHDCLLEDCVTLSPGVHLGGRVIVRRETFLGINASTISDIEIGAYSIVAAGACVTNNLPDHVMAAGVPAEIKKHL